MSNKIKAVIIDYQTGNINSLKNLLKKSNCEVAVSNKRKIINQSELLVLPGVGNFGHAIKNLKKNNIFDFLKKKIVKDKIPTIGICLGMQILFRKSDEDKNTKGLSIFKRKINKTKKIIVGWNKINFLKGNKTNEEKYFYFNHNYGLIGKFNYTTAFMNNTKINSIIHYKNIIGFQFHPEKSQSEGEKLFNQLVKLIL